MSRILNSDGKNKKFQDSGTEKCDFLSYVSTVTTIGFSISLCLYLVFPMLFQYFRTVFERTEYGGYLSNRPRKTKENSGKPAKTKGSYFRFSLVFLGFAWFC